MKKLITLILLNLTIVANAQISVGGNATSSAWTYGGYAGIGAGSGGTSIYITPRIGYKLVENFEMGLAGNFTWSNSSYHNSTMIGVGPFTNYYFARTAYISGMFQEYFINYNNKTNSQNSSKNEAVLYLGGGYMQQLGNNAYMQIGAMYNVLYNPDKSVFSTGFIPQVGIVFGL